MVKFIIYNLLIGHLILILENRCLYLYIIFNDDTSKIKTYVGEDGKIHFVDKEGADSVLNFSSNKVTVTTNTFYMNDNNGNPNGAIVNIGFKPDVLIYYFLNNGNVKVTGFWKKEFGTAFIMSNGDGVFHRSFASGGGSTWHRAALSEINNNGFKLYGGYSAGTGTYWAYKFE